MNWQEKAGIPGRKAEGIARVMNQHQQARQCRCQVQ